MRKKVLFIDRDGTLIVEPPDEQVDSLEKLEFLPGVIVNLHKIATELDFELVMVTNQDGLGTTAFPEEKFWIVQNKMLTTLANEGILFSDILIDRTVPQNKAPTRKPGTGMLTDYMTGDYDLKNSFVIGDRITDINLAQNLGCQAIYISKSKHAGAVLSTTDWGQVYQFLACPPRTAQVNRITGETNISLKLNLDGTGQTQVETGLGFFNHMLELLARHSGCDIELKVNGDLNVDEHHTIEDTAMVLGEGFTMALGDKRGIGRYGFLLPMDESLAQVALDFSGRSQLIWQVTFKREKIGDMPTEMFYHFFKSFCDTARCTLNIKAEGGNEHHKIEAVFKAIAKAIKMAITRDPGEKKIPSTKGVL
jgi:imidazoleglycerol-phosphate dehydratase/histidinol-phosphatase